jgi:phosphatidylserine/phosphatidylglycerophosphate/cardiolipin synthase-like enzyme
MKLSYLFFSILLCICVACSSNNNPTSGGGGADTLGINIEDALFINPLQTRAKASDPHIMDKLIFYLDHTPKGAVVHINIYLFDYKPVLDAIERAYKRGVTLKILIDNKGGDHTRNLKSINTLQDLFESPSEVIPVVNDARPSMTAIDHNKYAIFTEVDLSQGLAKNLVWASSHNFSLGQTKKIQDAVFMTNIGLYKAFLDNWNEIASRADHGMKNFPYMVKDVGDSITAFFFPRRINGKWDGKNTVIEQLDKLKDNYNKDTVRVYISEMHASAGIKIAKKLTALQKKGVTVQLITRAEAPQVSAAVKSELLNGLKKAGGYVKLIDNSKEGTVHAKTMMIKGNWDGKKDQKLVLTGSLNYHIHATNSNNNFLLLLKNSALFNDYWHYFVRLKEIL